MKKNYLLAGMLSAALPALAQMPLPPTGPLPLTWTPRADLNVLLPPSVRVYDTFGTLPDGRRVRAQYTKMALRDPNLRLKAVGQEKGPNFRLRTTRQEYDAVSNAIWAANGGFFSPSSSVSLVISDGTQLASNQPVFSQGGTSIYPTRGAFGLVNQRPDVAWVYSLGTNANGAGGLTYAYPEPNPVATLQTQPSATFPAGAAIWNASQAVGGTPVLVHEGKIRITGPEENTGGDSFLGPNPRTAVGYLPGDTVIVVTVDGRQQASGGVTIAELAQMMLDLGTIEALNLDGGGSSTMLAAGEVVNNPADRDGGDRNQLRANASALVLAEATPTPRRPVTIVDAGSAGYNEIGLWSTSNHASYYSPSPSRLATINGGQSRARYALSVPARGRYQLAAWWTFGPDNARRVPYVLHRGTRTDTLFADQRSYQTLARWNVLGNLELSPGDYVELLAQGQSGTKVVADALRLVELERFPAGEPARGNLRIAVVADLNGSLGSATYEYQVDSIMQRIPRLWRPDLVVCGGDMVAGQGVSTQDIMRKMWQGFDKTVASNFRAAGIPFAFTLGNHDGVRSLPLERDVTKEYWQDAKVKPALDYVDQSNYPIYYSFKQGDAFFVSWDASSSKITDENLAWVRAQFSSPQAQAAKMRFLIGHIPLYAIAQERDSPGNILDNNEQLRHLLEELKVKTYISGHHHAYFPGKRGELELLNAGAAGTGPRPWLTLDKAPVNTVTLMDIFFDQDSVNYTTYDIATPNAADMTVFDPTVLPRIIYSYDGTFIIRRDAPLGPAQAQLAGLHLDKARPGEATGAATASLGGGKLRIEGSFSNLSAPLLPARDAVALYGGRHGGPGPQVAELKVLSADGRSGTFSALLDAKSDTITDQFRAGALFVRLRTTANPEGELRGQLYGTGNQPPAAVEVSSTRPGNVYAMRNLEAIFGLDWPNAGEPDGDAVTYLYQLATDASFAADKIVYQEGTGRLTSLRRREDAWYALLGNAPAGQPVSFYQRIVVSDGYHRTNGPAQLLRLTKSDAPVEDLVEVPAPEFRYDGPLVPGASGYGATYDGTGKLWLTDYYGRIYVLNRDGSAASFSPLLNKDLPGVLGNNTGLSTDADGNILLSTNSRLSKLDAATGQVLASWTAPLRANGNANTLTTARPDASGRVFVSSLWGDDYSYVLRQQGTSFELVRRLTLPGRVLAREFAMEPDGLTLYLPDPGTALIQRFVSRDTVSYTLAGTINSLSAGSSGLQVLPGGRLYAAVRASGAVPASIHFRDEQNKRLWTLPLPELGNVEARGLGVSSTGDTLIYCAWNGKGIHRYIRQRPGGPGPVVGFIPTYPIAALRGTNANGVVDSLGVYCKVEGIVSSPSFYPGGLDFSLVQDGKALNVLRATDNAGYTVTMGDRLRAVGRVTQENGFLRFQTDSVRRLATGQPVVAARPVPALVDSLESVPVELRGLRLLDATQWTSGRGFPGFGVDATDGIQTVRVFISSQTDLYQQLAPAAGFDLRGVVRQYKIGEPYVGSYELWPRFRADLSTNIITATQPVATTEAILYPNPTNRQLTVRLAGGGGIRAVQVLTTQGRLVLSETYRNALPEIRLPVGGLPAGLYLVRINTNAGTTLVRRFEKI